MKQSSRVIILVKAFPQPSKKHVETVCCAGITGEGLWKRLFPIRFRQLSGDQAFKRWDIVEFDYSRPQHDSRIESCRVHEESISVVDHINNHERRSRLLSLVIIPSEKVAIERNQSLALIEPKNIRFHYKKRTLDEIDRIKEAYKYASRQTSFLDKEMAEIDPSPYDFKISYDDEAGRHTKTCGDWEMHATYRNFSRALGDSGALEKMEHIFNVEYPRKGVLFALGNMAKRPQTWQLLGVIRAEFSKQTEMRF